LEAIKLQEINRLIRSFNANRAQDSDNPALIFTARVEGDGLVFPWETAAAKGSAAFARHRQEGEAQEFIKQDYAGAAAAYAAPLAAAGGPTEMAEARLLVARALSKAANPRKRPSYTKLC